MDVDTNVYNECYCISGLVSQNIDNNAKIYKYDGHSNEKLVPVKIYHIE